jgi:hypothetical protein
VGQSHPHVFLDAWEAASLHPHQEISHLDGHGTTSRAALDSERESLTWKSRGSVTISCTGVASTVTFCFHCVVCNPSTVQSRKRLTPLPRPTSRPCSRGEAYQELAVMDALHVGVLHRSSAAPFLPPRRLADPLPHASSQRKPDGAPIPLGQQQHLAPHKSE